MLCSGVRCPGRLDECSSAHQGVLVRSRAGLEVARRAMPLPSPTPAARYRPGKLPRLFDVGTWWPSQQLCFAPGCFTMRPPLVLATVAHEFLCIYTSTSTAQGPHVDKQHLWARLPQPSSCPRPQWHEGESWNPVNACSGAPTIDLGRCDRMVLLSGGRLASPIHLLCENP